jgi:hypothetical protein
LTCGNAAAGLNWVARARTQQMLAELTIGAVPVTRQFLEGPTPNGAILIQADVLCARDERLIRLDSTVEPRMPASRNQRHSDPAELRHLAPPATTAHARSPRATDPRSGRLCRPGPDYLHPNRHRRPAHRRPVLSITRVRQLGRQTWPRARHRGPPFNNESVCEVLAELDQRWSLARRRKLDRRRRSRRRAARPALRPTRRPDHTPDQRAHHRHPGRRATAGRRATDRRAFASANYSWNLSTTVVTSPPTVRSRRHGSAAVQATSIGSRATCRTFDRH